MFLVVNLWLARVSWLIALVLMAVAVFRGNVPLLLLSLILSLTAFRVLTPYHE